MESITVLCQTCGKRLNAEIITTDGGVEVRPSRCTLCSVLAPRKQCVFCSACAFDGPLFQDGYGTGPIYVDGGEMPGVEYGCIVCRTCGARGPVLLSPYRDRHVREEIAWEKWNTRYYRE